MSIIADQPVRLPEVLQAAGQLAPPLDGRAALPRLLVGITGAPGSGKSTLTDALVRTFRLRHPDRPLGVVAVDPSSPFTGGAVLGDRVRMMRHATDPFVFVRSMASRGHLGGLALGVKGVIRVMGLLGCEVVFVETVGVGQSEVEIAGVADVVLIVLAPGQGDGIQMLKAGLLEVGDLFVVNKSDRPDAARLHGELLAMLRAASEAERPEPRAGHPVEPRAFLVSSEQGRGIDELASELESLAGRYGERWQAQRVESIERDVLDAVFEEAGRRLRERLVEPDAGPELASAVIEGRLSVGEAAARLLDDTTRGR